jgi:predicted metal-dependent HD superfamily phosphohydrolase
LIGENIREGYYWGNEKQFRKMQSKLLDKLLEIHDDEILRKVRSTNGMD